MTAMATLAGATVRLINLAVNSTERIAHMDKTTRTNKIGDDTSQQLDSNRDPLAAMVNIPAGFRAFNGVQKSGIAVSQCTARIGQCSVPLWANNASAPIGGGGG